MALLMDAHPLALAFVASLFIVLSSSRALGEFMRGQNDSQASRTHVCLCDKACTPHDMQREGCQVVVEPPCDPVQPCPCMEGSGTSALPCCHMVQLANLMLNDWE